MNSILHKVQSYLDKVSKEPVKISDKLVEEFMLLSNKAEIKITKKQCIGKF